MKNAPAYIAVNIDSRETGGPGPKEFREGVEDAVRQVICPAYGKVIPVTQALHVTLRFLGHSTPEQLEEMERTCRNMEEKYLPIMLGTDGSAGIFRSEKGGAPDHVWAGVGGDLETLRTIQGEIEARALEVGYDPPDYDFNPHITVAKVEDEQREWDESKAEMEGMMPRITWQVQSIALMVGGRTRRGQRKYRRMGPGRARPADRADGRQGNTGGNESVIEV